MEEQDKPSGKVKVILVVEDDADLGEFFVTALKEETPYQALLVYDGFEALKMVRGLKPDLLVLDYLLPSMNGLDLYDQLHALEELKDIPTLFMSANAPTSELKKRRVYYIKKTFELDEMFQTIEHLLKESLGIIPALANSSM